MKKIFIALLAVAALAACTKSEVQFDEPESIGFQVVSGKMTKAAVTDTKYPEDLNMYVFAMTKNNDAANASADYLDNAEFAKVSVSTDSKNLWGGWKNNAAYPYYWPNVTPLYFAGVSASGNVNNGVVPAYNNGTITLDGYVSTPGTTTLGDNDLMWFPLTKDSYVKTADYVPVTMKHACSWITIMLAGDAVTANNYTVTDIQISGLTTKGKAELKDAAAWTLSTEADYTNQVFDVFTPAQGNTGTVLPTNATKTGFETVADNTIVLPNQTPGTLSITYQFKSQAGQTITETVTGSLKYDTAGTAWQPGVHYTYTVTITATQILIAPVVEAWSPSPETGGHTVTVK